MTQLVGTSPGSVPTAVSEALAGTYRAFDHWDMFDVLARARREQPVFHSPEIGYWVVTRRADVLATLADAERFSAAIALSPVRTLPQTVIALLAREGYAAEATQVSADPPKHTRIRTIAGRLLSAKAYAPLEPRLRDLVVDACKAIGGSGEVDLVADFAYELPARVVFLLLGIPDADTPRIKAWADDRLLLTVGELDEPAQLRAAAQMADYWRYCVALVEDRKRAPGADYASQLLAFRDGDDARLTENEIASLVFGLLLAGHETTSNMTANAVHALLSDGAAWRRLVEEPALIPNAVEETLRFASSVVCWRRRASVDVEIGGVSIPAGANILLSLGSANRDEAHFTAGDRLDIQRANARDHVSFGHGLHFCLGAPLARMELRIILEELTRRFPGMRLLDPSPPDMIRTIAFRGPKKLLVHLGEPRS